LDFLVELEVVWPPDGDPNRRAELIKAEAARAAELAAQGHIKRLWRIPGRWANVGLWHAKDATELHAAIASLPFFPWIKAEVRPLADHPNDPALKKG